MGLDRYSPKEWDWFVTMLADCKQLDGSCYECIYENECDFTYHKNNCPVCSCFGGDCMECMGDEPLQCLKYNDDEVVDRLIERLEREGIFKEEELMEVSMEKVRGMMKKYPEAEEAIRELLGCLPSFVIIIRDHQCKSHWLILKDGEFGPGEIKNALTKYSENDRARVLARQFGLDREGVIWEWCFTEKWARTALDRLLEELLAT